MASALPATFTTTCFLNKVFPLQEGLPSAYCHPPSLWEGERGEGS